MIKRLSVFFPVSIALIILGCSPHNKSRAGSENEEVIPQISKTGELKTEEWIRSREVGGISLANLSDDPSGYLRKMGYEIKIRNTKDRFNTTFIGANRVMENNSNNEICANNGTQVSLIIIIEKNIINNIRCLTDNDVINKDPTYIINDNTEVGHAEIHVFSLDYSLKSFRDLHGINICNHLKYTDSAFIDFDGDKFCSNFIPPKSPYIYSLSIDNVNTLGGNSRSVTIQNNIGIYHEL